ncbi:MAG TPA: DUF364 domain-containing protein [Anaerolineae bacterium]|nr:DUF364 domain-containing protein [Anaerolineae bacterium]
MTLIERIVHEVAPVAAEATPVEVLVGAYWTLTTISHRGTLYAGLASTLGGGDEHHHGGGHPLRQAGHLLELPVTALADLARSANLLEASVGMATLNALLAVTPQPAVALNAEEIIAERGAGKRVAIVGHFPFTERIRQLAATLWVLELRPRAGDEPAERAPELLPQADVVALTGTSLLNGTFETLLSYCRPEAYVLVLGATTPLSKALLEVGVAAVSGTRVVDVAAARVGVMQGATFRQIEGKLPVTLFRER